MGRVEEQRIDALERAVDLYYETLGAIQGTPCHLYITEQYLAWGFVDMEDSEIGDTEFEEKFHLKMSHNNMQRAVSELFAVNDTIKVHTPLSSTKLWRMVRQHIQYLAGYNEKHGVIVRTIGRHPDELLYEKDGEYHYLIEEQAESAIGLTKQNSIPLVEIYKQWRPKRIVEELDKYVLGQQNAKRALARAAYWHLQRIHDIEVSGSTSMENQSVLLLGPTGAGKTLLSRKLGEILGLPFVAKDVTALTAAGYVGEDIEDYMREMWAVAGGNRKRLNYGIFLIDEIDKLASQSGNRDVNGKGAQQRLLRFTEGSRMFMNTDPKKTYPGPPYLDSSHTMKIFSGSFMGNGKDDLAGIIKKRTRSASIGFGSDVGNTLEVLADVSDEDLLTFGILRELAARMTLKAAVQELSVDDLRRILTEPKESLIEQYTRAFQIDGHALHIDESALMMIAEEAKRRGSNARSLRPIVDLVLGPIQEELAGDEPTDINVTRKDVEKAISSRFARTRTP